MSCLLWVGQVLRERWPWEFRVPAILLFAAMACSPLTAIAAWPPTGVLLGNYPGVEFTPIAATDGMGGAFVVWGDERNLVDHDLYIQRVLYDGQLATGWPTTGVPLCVAP